ncbi:MAG: nitrogen regulation protein NR(I), partial [Alphaproteobacteria bacterium]|nr:nitrogen regulation protein NR(I) [Alphaproteobacteria bacterium]
STVVQQILPTTQLDRGYSGESVERLENAVRIWAKDSLLSGNLGGNGGEGEDVLHDALLSVVEPVLLKEALLSVDGNQIRAAQILGINRNTLRKKLNDYDVDPASLRRSE